jgi:hypothetical protein
MSDAPRRSLHALATSWPYRAIPFGPPIAPLQRSGPRSLDAPTETLRRSLEPHACTLARGKSIGSIDTLIESAWFPTSANHFTLADHLSAVATRTLQWCGPAVRLAPCAPDHRSEQAEAWRRLSLFLPTDLLIAALPTDRAASTDHVELLDPLLARMLEQPVAETHLHSGAAIDFGVLWLATLHDLTWGPPARDIYDDAHDGLGSKRAHGRLLCAAILVRHMLLAFLWHRSEGRRPYDFERFLASWLPSVERSAPRFEFGWNLFDAVGAAWGLLHLGPARDVSALVLRRALRVMAGSRPPKIQTVDDLIASDPVAQWLPPGAGLARPETRLLQGAMEYLREAGRVDAGFARVFWQYVRVRTLVFGRLVQTPGVAGLDWFSRHFARIRHYRGKLDDRIFESALRLNERGLALASIEVRTSPGGIAANRSFIRKLVAQNVCHQRLPGRQSPQVGLIFHFIKTDKAGTANSRPHASPEARVFGTRYGRWFNEQWMLAGEIGRTLEYQPEALLILRGLDVAASELAIPNWPLVPLFERVRRAAARAARRLASTWPRCGVEGLSTTLHLGEEFQRLSDGLRRIHEAVEFGLLRPGDRIGHGLALGLNCATWASGNPTVVQRREERLDDLLWELDRYESGQVEGGASRLALVRAQASDLAGSIYYGERSAYVAPDALRCVRKARHQRFDSTALSWLNYPRLCRTSPPRQLELLYAYLTDLDIYRRGAELIEVHVDDQEVEFLGRVQGWLRHQLALLGITIESNPSSNLLIGDFADFREHPTFRLSPLAGDNVPLDGRLPVSINTDDPLTFATCLADEYAHMYFALIGRGVTTRDALEWLDQAREAGWRSRFTLPASTDRMCLETLLPRPR